MSSRSSTFITAGAEREELADAGLRRELALLSQALDNSYASVFVSLVAAVGLALDMGGLLTTWVGGWLGVAVFTAVLRLIVEVGTQRLLSRTPPSLATVRRYRRVHVAGLVAGGLLWSYMGWTGLETRDIAGQFKIIIIVSALAGGATGVLAPLRLGGPLYIALVLTPACVKLALLPEPHRVLSALGLVFMGVMIVGHRNNHRLILRTLRLQEDNRGLIEGLKSKNAEVEAMNHFLEDRVTRRTEDLRAMAHRDALTGLFNRRGIVQGLERLLARLPEGTARSELLGVLFLDLDRFKQINDGIGHDVGDLVLLQVAKRFKACVPAQAVFGRWGGDEFIVIIGGTTEVRSIAQTAAAGLQSSLDTAIEIHGERLNLGVSIGMAFYPSQAASPAELIRAADLAAAEAKRLGRDRVVEFQPGMAATQRRRLELSLALRVATRDNSLRLVYQPIVDAHTGRVNALEALLRWNSPVLGEVRPDEFIPIAEESDRIVEIGAWVLRRACSEAMGWTGAPRVSVNVSVRQLQRADFPTVVQAALQASGLPPQRLTLEVTESVFAEQHSANALAALVQLHALGVHIDVDDFGIGYSSLSRLREFPLDAIKIDRSFVAVLDGPSRAIIEGTVLMARRFGLSVIAEGIETREQASQLLAMGVDAFQGFLFGRPRDVAVLRGPHPFWVAGPEVAVPGSARTGAEAMAAIDEGSSG